MQQGNGVNLLVQGRIVWTVGNNLFEGENRKDFNTGVVLTDDAGNPIKNYGFGLAIPKVNPQTGQENEDYTKTMQGLNSEAYSLYPNGQLPPDFAMKYKDGDGVDHNGVNFSEREGYAGHIILACTTQIPIKYFIYQGGNNILVNDGIKCGDYVNVQLNVKAHPPKGRGKAGLYINPFAVQLIQPGKEIVNVPSGDGIFGTVTPVYKGGNVEAPQVNTMPDMASQMGAPQGHEVPPNSSQQPRQGNVPQPHYGVLPQNLQQPQQANVPQPQQANVPQPQQANVPQPQQANVGFPQNK